jgi:cell division protease FtsH
LGGNDEEVFLGHSITRHKEVSEAMSSMVDTEVRNIVDRNYQRAEKILKDNIDKLHIMAEALIKYETINVEQINDVMEGRTIREPANWRSNKDDTTKGKRKDDKTVQDQPEDKQQSLSIGDDKEGTASAHGTSTN